MREETASQWQDFMPPEVNFFLWLEVVSLDLDLAELPGFQGLFRYKNLCAV